MTLKCENEAERLSTDIVNRSKKKNLQSSRKKHDFLRHQGLFCGLVIRYSNYNNRFHIFSNNKRKGCSELVS